MKLTAKSIKAFRKRNLYTQEDLARLIGVTSRIVSRWEDGKLPSVTNQRKLIALLNPETKAVSNGN